LTATQDQVVRLRAFCSRYPDWYVSFDRGRRIWRAERITEDGSELIVRFDLASLIDRLEALCASRGMS